MILRQPPEMMEITAPLPSHTMKWTEGSPQLCCDETPRKGPLALLPSLEKSPFYSVPEVASTQASFSSQQEIISNTTSKRRGPSLSLWKTKWFINWWGPEIANWLIAALAVAAILITLNVHNGRALPDWPFGITINALISVFATIGEMAMMRPVSECMGQLKWLWFTKTRPIEEFQAFDAASRGRLGSLKLLAKLRGMHLASLGATITVVTLAFGPLTQQVVAYPSRLKASGTASTPQVLTYPGMGPVSQDATQESLTMYSAITSGVSSVGATFSSVQPFCNSGNCNWPPYSSLGICATVDDVSENLVEDPCSAMYYNESIAVNGVVPCFNYTFQAPAKLNEPLSIPFAWGTNGTDTNGTAGWETSWETNAWNWTSIGLSTMLYLIPYGSPVHPNLGEESPVQIIYLLHQPLANSTSTKAVAFEIRLNFCEQNFETRVKSGNTTTTLTSSENLTMDQNGDLSNNATATGLGLTVPYDVASSLYDSLGVTFTGECNGLSNSSEIELICTSNLAQAFGKAANQASGLASDIQNAIEDLVDNLAISMTNAMRQGTEDTGVVVQVSGTAYSPETYIHAEYVWLVLPIGLVYITLVFLVATISKSQKAKAEVWKSSSLPVLRGLDHKLHQQLGGLYMMDEIETISKLVEARLEKGGDKGWHLSRS